MAAYIRPNLKASMKPKSCVVGKWRPIPDRPPLWPDRPYAVSEDLSADCLWEGLLPTAIRGKPKTAGFKNTRDVVSEFSSARRTIDPSSSALGKSYPVLLDWGDPLRLRFLWRASGPGYSGGRVSPFAVIGASLDLGTTASVLAVSPDDQTLYVAIVLTGSVQLIDVTSDSQVPLRSTTSIPVLGAPLLALSPDGKTLFVVSGGSTPAALYLWDPLAPPPQFGASPFDVPQSLAQVIVPSGPLWAIWTVAADTLL